MLNPDPTLALIPRAVAGDAAAFEQLARLLYPRIRLMAYKWSLSEADADDLTQDALIKLARHIHDFRSTEAFPAWISRLVLNCLRDAARVRQRAQQRDTVIEDADTVEAGLDPERITAGRQDLQNLDILPAALRETLWLVFGLGNTQTEAAEILGCAAGTIAWRIAEARRLLAAMQVQSTNGRIRA